jgi:hypothetical protein
LGTGGVTLQAVNQPVNKGKKVYVITVMEKLINLNDEKLQ